MFMFNVVLHYIPYIVDRLFLSFLPLFYFFQAYDHCKTGIASSGSPIFIDDSTVSVYVLHTDWWTRHEGTMIGVVQYC